VPSSHRPDELSLTLAWLRQQAGVGAPIASARTAGQLDALIESFRLTLTPVEFDQLE